MRQVARLRNECCAIRKRQADLLRIYGLPRAEFAKQFGLTEIMPALCNVDYASMELIGAKLIRKGTCVDGDKCDYTICGDKDEFCKSHPEYIDEKGYRRNK